MKKIVAATLLSLTTLFALATDTVQHRQAAPFAAMSGTYTVNPAAALTATNFQTLQQVTNSLNTNGVSGAVIIQVYNGNYTAAPGTVNAVAGVSATNTITYTSFSNDSIQAKVSLLLFSNMSHVIIRKLWVDAVTFTGSSNNCTLQNNSLKTISWTAGSNLTITNNNINGGIAVSGAGGMIGGILVKNNIIRNGAFDGNASPYLTQFYKVSKPKFEGNTFSDFSFNHRAWDGFNYQPYKGTFYFVGCADTAFFTGNRFQRCASTRVVCDESEYQQTQHLAGVEMYNNFISATGIFDISKNDIQGNGVPSLNYYFNNFENAGQPSAGNPGFVLHNFGNFKNNIFSSKYGAITCSVTQGDYSPAANNNNFYTTGAILVQRTNANASLTNFATLAQWQAATGADAASLSINPKYYDSVNLHVQHPALLAAGVPVPAANPVLVDIDDDNRNSLNPSIGADEFFAPSADVVAKQFVGSKKDFPANAPQQLAITFLNNGSANLAQLKVRWSVNGVEQLPAFTWTGNLPYDSSATVTFGAYHFEMLKYSYLKIWTDLPNGVPDMVPTNDTLRIDSIMPSARGVFTLGGTLPSLPTFTKAAELLSYGGVDSAVTVLVRNGKYTEQPIIKFVRGASIANTITYRGESNSAALDTLSFSSTGTGANQFATLKLDSAAFHTFKTISFQSVSSYSREVEFTNKCRFITFDSCVFTSAFTNPTFPHIDNVAYTFGVPTLDSNATFMNNRFVNGGYAGIKLPLRNGIIKGNRFEGLYDNSATGNAIEVSGTGNNSYLVIDSNYISNPLVCTYAIGATCYSYGVNSVGGITVDYQGTGNSISITRNRVYTQNRRALLLRSSGSAANPVKVYNNFFSGSRSNILRITGSHSDIAFNTFADSTNHFVDAIEIEATPVTLRNNIFSKSMVGVGPASTYHIIRLSSAAIATGLTSNHNAFFFSDTTRIFYNGTASQSLSQWQAATGKDLASRRATPAFKSYADLHIDKSKAGAVDIARNGTPMANVPNDIDDSTRSTTAPCIGADEFILNGNDAGAMAITNLNYPVVIGSNNVLTSIRNYGSNALTSAAINWSVNGAVQTPYNWSGSLATGDSATAINIGSYNFGTPGTYNLQVWTTAPNGATDEGLPNDTATKAVYPALCGTYTIGGAAPTFTTMGSAMQYLSLGGVTCATVFNIRDGAYVESDTLNTILGSSAINTVTFQSQSLDSSKVSLSQSQSFTASPNSVLRLNGATHVTFKALTFQRTPDPLYNFYFDVITIAGNGNGTTFTNCAFVTNGSGKLVQGPALPVSSGYTFSNNSFTGGATGISLAGANTSLRISGISITGNKFNRPIGSGNTSYSIDLAQVTAANVEGNFLDSCVSARGVGGISIGNSMGKITVLKNTILKRKGANGINLQSVTGGPVYDSAAIVANNFITVDSSAATVGIYSLSTGRNVKLVYNNILNNSSSAASRALQFSNSYNTGALKDTIANNNIVSLVAGYGLHFQQGAVGDVHLTNNNIFTAGSAVIASYNGTNYTTVTSLPTAGGTNTGNVQKNPLYTTPTNLHIGELSLRLDGKPLPYILTDIDNDVRGTTTSTIGADEIVVNNFDIGVAALASPQKPFAAGTQAVTVGIKNYGSSTISTATVNWTINGVAQAPYSFSGSIPFGATVNATLASPNFIVDSAYVLKFWTASPNGGTDALSANDTLLAENMYPALSGTYTLGGTAPDFKGFTRSMTNLRYGGMLGNVTFNARAGRYNDVLQVDSIPFQNNYGVTWQSENGDSSVVVLNYKGLVTDLTTGVVQLSNAKNITIRQLTVQAKFEQNNGSPAFKSIVYFTKKNKGIRFISNQFIDSTYEAYPGTNNTGVRFFYNRDDAASGSNANVRSADSALVIDKNLFKQANVSPWPVIDLGGSTTTSFGGVVTVVSHLNNVLMTANRYDVPLLSKVAVEIAAADSVRIVGNQLNGRVAITGKDLLLLDKNTITHEGYNQSVVTVTATAGRAVGKPAVVSNNLIQSVRVGTFNGTPVGNNGLVVTGDRVNVIHNTIVTTDTGNIQGWATSAAFVLASGQFDTVKNNVFYNMAGGNIIGFSGVTNLVSNNNDYVYSNHFSITANNLAQHRTMFGQDAQSVEGINPYFRGPKDLHASNILLRTAPQLTAYATDVDGQSRSATVSMGADEFTQPVNDMVITEVVPGKIFPQGLNDIKLRIYNNGSAPISSFTVSSSLTNYLLSHQPTTAGTINYTFSGNIAPGSSELVTIGQMNVPMYRNRLKVNATALNGVGDEVPYTDSVQNDAFWAGLNGTYTAKNNTNAAPATFSTFADLETQLEQGGVYGPSTVNVLPGIYETSMYIDSIPNRGAASPLVIQSQNGDSSTTGFAMNSTGTTLTLYRASHVTIRNLYFGPNPVAAFAPIYQIALGWNSQNISVENCKIVNNTASLTTAANTGSIAVMMAGNWVGQTDYTDSNFVFKNNLVIGGGSGISTNGYGSAFASKNVRISNNRFVNQYSSSVEVQGIRNTLIDSNTIESNTPNDAYKAINLVAALSRTIVIKNKILVMRDGAGIYNEDRNTGLYSGTDTLRISNNFITVGESKPSKGIWIQTAQNGKQLQVVYNSILNRSTAAASTAFSNTTGQFGGRSEVMNNIFYNRYAGLPVYINRYAPVTYIQHHNNLFTAGAVYGQLNGTNYNTLAAFSATGVDYSSVSGDPLFITDADLHVDGAVNNNTGTIDANVVAATDIDNEARSSSNPDMGADEFSLPNFGAVQLEAPLSSCSHTATEPVKAWVKNYGTQPRYNIPVAYRINGGAIVRDTVRTTVAAGDSVLYTFTQTADLSAPMAYYFDVFTNYRGDSLPANDTLKQWLVATTPSNNILPYYTGFEGTAAGWYTGGQNSSFKWGAVFSGVIDSAANGLAAWKSNLTGPHNNTENSYLYSPCFNLSSLSADPTLNFNLAFQLEAGTDKAWVEMSADAGATWTKLGAQGDGLGWYNNAGGYWTGNNRYWHNAKHVLPIASLTDKTAVRLRFVLQSNGAVVQDGLAIDDISIYTGDNPPVSGGTYVGRTATSTGSGTFIPVNDPSGNRLVEINDNGQTLGTITVDVAQNNGGVPTTYNGQTYLGRNWVIKVQNAPVTPVRVRLFFTQAEFDAWKAMDPTIDQVRSISVYKFSGSVEDFSLANNSSGTPLTVQPAQITKIPYQDGYFLEFSVSSFSEFWVTKGGNLSALPVRFVNLAAQRNGTDVALAWKTATGMLVNTFDVERSTDGSRFTKAGTVAATTGVTAYTFTDAGAIATAPVLYYRIKAVGANGEVSYSATVVIKPTADAVTLDKVFPNPFHAGLNVQFTVPMAGKATLQLLDNTGRVVATDAVSVSRGVNTISLYKPELSSGSYLVQLLFNGKTYVQKVAKQ